MDSPLQEVQEQRRAKMARYTPTSAPYEELQALRAQRLEVGRSSAYGFRGAYSVAASDSQCHCFAQRWALHNPVKHAFAFAGMKSPPETPPDGDLDSANDPDRRLGPRRRS